MQIVSRMLFWVGVLCIGVFFYPSIGHENLPNGYQDRITIGLPGSPWYDRQVTHTDLGTSPEGVQMARELQKVNTRWISWSTLFPVLGIALIAVARYLRLDVARSS
jgi:hypothetical protein